MSVWIAEQRSNFQICELLYKEKLPMSKMCSYLKILKTNSPRPFKSDRILRQSRLRVRLYKTALDLKASRYESMGSNGEEGNLIK